MTILNTERLAELVSEFEGTETEHSRRSEIISEIQDGYHAMANQHETSIKQLEDIKHKNEELRKTNSHYANRLASQFVDSQEKQQIKKQEEKKTKTLSDVLGQY